ncbi:PREDICTED: uncharacterized protein LOC108973326 [Bactrocera latifrons]|uniref:uncharacterized protein LOC108973326 n=1 Tax=Bactrocera latifrons TaxID=174628 RepID=UPI0008DE2326|nr:PREDICTED: uncharacterized protein LOC108973326 [Bactrocera latifrons]
MPTKLDAETIALAQLQDDQLNDVQSSTSRKLHLLNIKGHYILCDVTNNIVRPYLPQPLRRQAFDIIYGLSHPSGRATAKELTGRFVWAGIRKDALLWSRHCIPCQRFKVHRHNRATPNHIDVPDNRFEHVHLDLIQLPRVKDLRYCLTIIDRFSRWPHAIPLNNMAVETVAHAFYTQWICQFDTPLTITIDQGLQFESELFTSLSRMLSIHRIRTTPYQPQSNGLVEPWHRTLKAALMCNNETPWPNMLSSVLLGLRTAYKPDLKVSPTEMLFGTTLRIPGDFFVTASTPADPQTFVRKYRQIIQAIRPTSTAHHTKHKLFLLKKIGTCTHVFKRVDSTKKPLEQSYTGPHEVIQRVGDKTYIIRINGADKTVSIGMLKQSTPQKSPPTSQSTPPNPTQKNSCLSLLDQVTGRRVDVATAPRQSTAEFTDSTHLPSHFNDRHSPATTRRDDSMSRPLRQRRKQTLQPRTDDSFSFTSTTRGNGPHV